jgi:cytochrome c peroxidase
VAYEQGPEFATFSSKYDYYLQGKVQLTAQEIRSRYLQITATIIFFSPRIKI